MGGNTPLGVLDPVIAPNETAWRGFCLRILYVYGRLAVWGQSEPYAKALFSIPSAT